MKYFVLIMLLPLYHQLAAQLFLTGTVKDATNGEPLPFASIGFEDSFVGTTSNGQGEFELKYPEQLAGQKVVISFLGYRSYSFIPKEKGNMVIQLTPVSIQLEEVVVLPLDPTEYLKRALRKIPGNYPGDPFESTGYYREQIKENGHFLKLTEAIFKSYYPAYQDTLKYQHQVALYRQKKDVKKLSFMRDEIEKAQEREAREAKKEGEMAEEDDLDESIVESNFGGPDVILAQDIVKEKPAYLDSNLFREFKYTFGGASTYQGKDLLIIEFRSRGKVDHMKQSGRIYLDITSDAIVAIEFRGKIVIPLLIQPVLFAVGFSIKDPLFEQRLRYQYHDGRWYPENFQWNVGLQLKKRHLFSANDKSQFDISQVFTVTEIKTTSASPVAEEKKFKRDKDLKDQVFNDGLEWSDVNIIQPDPLITVTR